MKARDRSERVRGRSGSQHHQNTLYPQTKFSVNISKIHFVHLRNSQWTNRNIIFKIASFWRVICLAIIMDGLGLVAFPCIALHLYCISYLICFGSFGCCCCCCCCLFFGWSMDCLFLLQSWCSCCSCLKSRHSGENRKTKKVWSQYYEEREPRLAISIRSLPIEPHQRKGEGIVGARGLEDTARLFSTPQLSLVHGSSQRLNQQSWTLNREVQLSAYILWLLIGVYGDS